MSQVMSECAFLSTNYSKLFEYNFATLLELYMHEINIIIHYFNVCLSHVFRILLKH